MMGIVVYERNNKQAASWHLRSLTVLLLFLMMAVAGAATARQAAVQSSAVTGRLDILDFSSNIFANTRKLRVLLPPSYAPTGTDAYAVLLLNDGQDLFDADTAVYARAEWRVDETLAGLWLAGDIPEFIVVGIDNAGRTGRANEYLPWYDEYLSPPLREPQGSRYPDFVVREVLPFLKARYRIKSGPENTAIGGASYGGLAALYTATLRPEVFGRVLVESPSIYVNNEAMLALLGEQQFGLSWTRAYLGAGTHEHIGAATIACNTPANTELPLQLTRLETLLGQKLTDPGRVLKMVSPCSTHHAASYARRFPAAVVFVMGFE